MVIISLFGDLGSNAFEIGKKYAKKNDLEFISFSGFPLGIENSQSLDYNLVEEEISILGQLAKSKNNLIIHSRFAHLVIDIAIKIKIQTNEMLRLSSLSNGEMVGFANLYGNLKMIEFYESTMAFAYFKNSNYSSNSNFNYCIDTSNKNLNMQTTINMLELYVQHGLKLI